MFGKKDTRSKIKDKVEEVQDAAHEAKQTVTGQYDKVREAAGDKAHEAGERIHEWKESVSDAAAQAWGLMAHRAGDLAQELAQRATEAAHKAGDAAHDRIEEPAHLAAQKAAEVAQVARKRFGSVKNQAASRAQDARTRAAELAHDAAAHTPVFLQSAAQNAALKAGTVGIKAGRALHDRAARYVPDYISEIKVVDKKADFTTKLLWLGVGVFTGVALGLLLAPTSGRRSRALMRDKLAKAGHEAGDLGSAAKKKASDLSNRATGLAHDLKDRVQPAPDSVDDATIEARVRTALGRHEAAKDLERFNIDVVDGAVTLRGPMVEEATRIALEAAVRAVSGVRDVKSALLVEAGEEDQAFVG